MKSPRSRKKKAVALRYDQKKDQAPKVTAKGEGLLADKIIELARRAGVPVKENQDLAEILSCLELNAEIPPETYVIVAEILAWVYQVNKSIPRESPSQ